MPRGYPGRVNKKETTPKRKEPGPKRKLKPRGKPFQKGSGGGPGRKAGVPNKMTTELKEAILEAASTTKYGNLVQYLRVQAEQENPSPFMTLIGRVLPHTIAGDPDQPLHLEASWLPPQ